MDVDNVLEALKFMALGMSVVFIFLATLIQAIKLQAFVIGKYFPDKVPVVPPVVTATNSDDEQARVAAVIAAVAEFRNNKS